MRRMPHTDTPVTRWQVDRRSEAAWRRWGGEIVVHHRLGNDSHRLAEPAGLILDRLAGGDALSADQILAGVDFEANDLAPALEALARLGFLVKC